MEPPFLPFDGHPFKVVDNEEMDQLTWSILTQGLLTPLVVRPLPNGEYEVVSGHRRLHACKKAGIETVPALIYAIDRDAAGDHPGGKRAAAAIGSSAGSGCEVMASCSFLTLLPKGYSPCCTLSFSLPQSKIKDFCQPPLHKGALLAAEKEKDI